MQDTPSFYNQMKPQFEEQGLKVVSSKKSICFIENLK